MPGENVGWGLTPGREGLSGLPTDEKPARNGFGKAGGILHHVRWEHPPRDNGDAALAAASLESSPCSGYLNHPFLKNETPQENNQAL